MCRTLVLLASLLFAAPVCAAGMATSGDMKYLYEYGDALYYAYQGEWFEAIARLDAAKSASGRKDGPEAETPSGGTGRVVGEFELNYRMDHRAGRAIEAVIGRTVRDDLRNTEILRLARMYFRKDRPQDALHALERVRGDVPEAIRPDLAFLRANIAMAVGRNAEAVAILKDLQGEKRLEGFSSYNLGIALLRTGSEQHGREYLDRAGTIRSDDRAVLAIKDKANLILGEKLLGESHFQAAKEVLDRVRLNGPFSNRALLLSGWADASEERFENALVPWGILAGRALTDPAVQEAMLTVPYGYSRLGIYSTAALKYESALEAFGREIDKLEASIASIREGKFLKSLGRGELRQDDDWIEKLRVLPVTPETLYLLDLMASNDFQESLKNYLDLEQLRKKLEAWSDDLVAFEDMVRRRIAHYKPLLSEIDRQFKPLDSRVRLRSMQRDRLAERLDSMLSEAHPELLATPEERSMSEVVSRMERMMTPQSEERASTLWHRVRRLWGVLLWNMYAEYDNRLAEARGHFLEMDREMDLLNRRHRAVLYFRENVESQQGYVDAIRRLRPQVSAAQKKVGTLIERQGQVLESMAVNELSRRRDRLEELRVKARFALADSYDRAGKAVSR